MKNLIGKKSILFSFLCFLCVGNMFAQSYPLGYCGDSIVRSTGQSYGTETYELGAAIKLDANKLAVFSGSESKISSVRIGLMSKSVNPNNKKDTVRVTVCKDLKVFISKTLGGENIRVKEVTGDVTIPEEGWLDVKFDEPLTIQGDEEFFVGYTMTANGLPIGADGSKEADANGTWVGVDGEWEQYADGGNFNVYALVTGEKIVARKALLEHFTTATCVNCPMVHDMLTEALKDNPNVAWVAHHTGMYGTMDDNYTISESINYLSFYNRVASVDGYYVPAIMFDRTNFSAYEATDESGKPSPGPVFYPLAKEMVDYFINKELNRCAFATVKIEEAFNKDNRELTVDVSGKLTIPEFLGDNVRLNVVLTEDGIVGPQAGATTSPYVHNNVIRKVLNGVWGEAVTPDADGNYSAKYTCTLTSSWVPAKMKIVAFLSNYDEKNVNNCEVYNAEIFNLKNDPTAITNTVANNEVNVYSNGSSIVIDGEYNYANIYDTTGKLVKTISKGACAVDKGIYMVKVVNGEQTVSKKIAIN